MKFHAHKIQQGNLSEVFYTLILILLDTREKEKKFKKLNGSKHSPNLICLQFLCECTLDMLLMFKKYLNFVHS